MAYPREDIDRVRAATDLAELAAEVTKVKRSGRSVMAVCPFHQEKTPSLSIDPERGLFHCFGCGKGGDVFDWVRETHSVDFVGALELLARRAGVAIREEPGAAKRRGRREELVTATHAALEFYHDRLRTASDAGSARSYLRSRGYESDVVEQFALGYAPDAWDALTKHLRSTGIGADVLVAAGLSQQSRTGRLIDRFRNRVMFPIFDLRGDPVAFGARILEGEGPKYLNSPETPIYHKSRLLYGLNWAKSEIVRSGRAVVVEGYTDVIAFHQVGAPIAVATCGTALGDDHLDLLRRFTERVVLAFDADAAGAGAALRGFEKAVPGDLDLRVAAMPEGRDPADLARNGGADLLMGAVDASEPLLQFRLDRELARFDLREPEGRGRAVRAAAALVARHPDPVVRHEYAVLIARNTGVEQEFVERAINESVRAGAPPAERAADAQAADAAGGQAKAEREMLRLLLANHPGVRRDDLDVELFAIEEHRAAYGLLAPAVAALEPGRPPDLGRLLSGSDPAMGSLLRTLALADRPLANPDDLLVRLRVGAVERRIEETRRELEHLDPELDPEAYSTRFGDLIALENRRRELRSVE